MGGRKCNGDVPSTITHGRAAVVTAGYQIGYRVAAGGFLGDWMLSHAHPYAPVVPAAVTAVVIAIAWATLKPRATSDPAGEQVLTFSRRWAVPVEPPACRWRGPG